MFNMIRCAYLPYVYLTSVKCLVLSFAHFLIGLLGFFFFSVEL